MAPRRNRLKLKPLREQVMVITGATSGIGLSTARAAARHGARLVLAARNETALKSVCEELAAKGAKTTYVIADVGREDEVKAIAAAAIERFGGFDTWVNDAGVTIIGPLTATPIEDQRRLFDTNYWGVVFGSLVAAEHLRTRPGGGAVVNMGSALSDLAIPWQGAYAASKHAVKAFTSVLRMELMRERAPVSVTLIKPAAIDTPYMDHAKNLTDGGVRSPPPVYATPLVAEAILYAAQHRVRELTIGAVGPVAAFLASLAPSIAEPVMAMVAPALQRGPGPAPPVRSDNLHHPGQDLRERAYYKGVREQSLYAGAQMHPGTTLTLGLLTGLAAGAALIGGRWLGRKPPEPEADPARQ
jgi:short-subunit dehydrogenase